MWDAAFANEHSLAEHERMVRLSAALDAGREMTNLGHHFAPHLVPDSVNFALVVLVEWSAGRVLGFHPPWVDNRLDSDTLLRELPANASAVACAMVGFALWVTHRQAPEGALESSLKVIVLDVVLSCLLHSVDGTEKNDRANDMFGFVLGTATMYGTDEVVTELARIAVVTWFAGSRVLVSVPQELAVQAPASTSELRFHLSCDPRGTRSHHAHIAK